MDRCVQLLDGGRMKVWVDIINVFYVYFFKGLIWEFEKFGYEIIIIMREFDGLIGIFDMFGFDYYVVGKYGGVIFEGKFLVSLERVYKFSKFIIEEKFDLVIYKYFVEVLRVVFGFQVFSIGFIDNEIVIGQNKFIVLFIKLFLYLRVIDVYELIKCGVDLNGMRFVNGFFELVYFYGFKFERKVLKEFGVKCNGYIVMCIEFIKVNYFNGDIKSIFEDVIFFFLDILIVLFLRIEEQRKCFECFDNVIMLEKFVDSLSFFYYVRLMIGVGGMMNREVIVFGILMIFIYFGKLFVVIKWFVEFGVKFYLMDFLEVVIVVERMIEMNGSYRNYIWSVVLGFENLMEVILKEIEIYEIEGIFFVLLEVGNVGSYVSFDKCSD